jgi:L-arabinose isomerase
MTDIQQKEIWFVTGSQHLYGEETLKQVAKNSSEIVAGLNKSGLVPLKIMHKDTVKTPDEITLLLQQANSSQQCIGIITWMHTFSPAKMWINGLSL